MFKLTWIHDGKLQTLTSPKCDALSDLHTCLRASRIAARLWDKQEHLVK